MPTVNLACVIGILAGIICSMAESVGDYYTCAKLSGAPPPPKHAISRGIGVEGLGCLLAGAFGTGNGTTSFSENVAALGITKVRQTLQHLVILHYFLIRLFPVAESSCFQQKMLWETSWWYASCPEPGERQTDKVNDFIIRLFSLWESRTSKSANTSDYLFVWQVGSRTVILLSGVFMILMGMLGKIGAIFTTIPTPVVGGMFLIMFGVITAAGISNLQVNNSMNSDLIFNMIVSRCLLLFRTLLTHIILQYTDMNSSRNIFVFGFSMFSALVIPNWLMKNPDLLKTGIIYNHISWLWAAFTSTN